MSSSAPEVKGSAKAVSFTEDALVVSLTDGRAISVPLDWYPRLHRATAAQRANWELSADGYGIHWPDVDEDISVRGLLLGNRSPEAAC
jgi:hypothetical protein